MEGYAMSGRKTLQGLIDRAQRGGWSVRKTMQGGDTPDSVTLLTMRRDGSRSLRFTLLTDALGTAYLARAAGELNGAWVPTLPAAAVKRLEAAP
ncbi:hypothetical protein ACWDR5_19440 [Streptomyces koyangensis]